MSLEQAIHERRRNFWEAIQAKAVPDSGIDLRRRSMPVKGGFKAERSKIVIDGQLIRRSEVIAHQRAQIQKRLDEINAATTMAAESVPAGPRAIRVEDVKEAARRHFGFERGVLESTWRHRKFTHPRQIAIFLAKEITGKSLPEIGRRFGGRDHTTAIHSIRRIKGLLKQGRQDVLFDVNAIKSALGLSA